MKRMLLTVKEEEDSDAESEPENPNFTYSEEAPAATTEPN
jgi:hypothetical protein